MKFIFIEREALLAHHARTVARSRSMRVDRCGCGATHVHLPHVTLHLDGAGLVELQALLTQALDTLSMRDAAFGLQLVRERGAASGEDVH